MRIFKNNNHLLVPYAYDESDKNFAWCYIFFQDPNGAIRLKEVSRRSANVGSLKEVTGEYDIRVYTESELSIELEKLSDL